MLLFCDPIRILSSFLREYTNTITAYFNIALSKHALSKQLRLNGELTGARLVQREVRRANLIDCAKISTLP